MMGISKMHQCLKGIAKRNKLFWWSIMTGSSTHECKNWTDHHQKWDCLIKAFILANLNPKLTVTLTIWQFHHLANTYKLKIQLL